MLVATFAIAHITGATLQAMTRLLPLLISQISLILTVLLIGVQLQDQFSHCPLIVLSLLYTHLRCILLIVLRMRWDTL